jgi:CheY-like chemotaxis protein
MDETKKIIISGDIRPLIKDASLFGRSKIRVFEASSNTEVLEIHKDEKTDLVIASLEMPGISTEEMCSEIRDNQELRDVSIIAVCPDCEENIKKSLEAGANSVITKPINTEVMVEEAFKLLNIAKRTHYRVPIAVKVEGKHKDKPFLGHSENISASGMLFASDKAIDVGDLILCSFIIDDEARITTDAEVVRVHGRHVEYGVSQCGIRFINPDEEQISIIDAFVKKEFDKNG